MLHIRDRVELMIKTQQEESVKTLWGCNAMRNANSTKDAKENKIYVKGGSSEWCSLVFIRIFVTCMKKGYPKPKTIMIRRQNQTRFDR